MDPRCEEEVGVGRSGEGGARRGESWDGWMVGYRRKTGVLWLNCKQN